MQSDITKRFRQLAALVALTTAPSIVAAQGTSVAGGASGAPQTGARAAPSMTAQPNTTSTAGAPGSTTGAAPGGYGDPNATSVSPPMGTPGADTMSHESGGDVDTNNGGGSKAGWLGLLGLLGLLGMRGRGTRHVDTTTTDARRV